MAEIDENEENSSIGETYSLMIKDCPEYLLSLVDKYVSVRLIKSTSYSGFVHSIDPVTNSIILSTPREDSYQTMLIPGHAVQDINETQAPDNSKPPLRKTFVLKYSDEEIIAKKSRLKAWFLKNLLPVSEEGDKIIVGSVSVLPPYNANNIYAERSNVGLHIQKIIKKMPQDFMP